VEAPRPSAKLSTIDTPPSVAANRGTEPAQLSKLMKGELDWELLKALEKDRTRRYDTANGLAREIQRYLADELVEARPPTWSYRLQKSYAKNRAAVRVASSSSSWLSVQREREPGWLYEPPGRRSTPNSSAIRHWMPRERKPNNAQRPRKPAIGPATSFADFPLMPIHCQASATCRNNLGLVLMDQGRGVEAMIEIRPVVSIREKLVADFPETPEHRIRLGNTYGMYGTLLHNEGKSKESLKWLDKAIGLLTPFMRSNLAMWLPRSICEQVTVIVPERLMH
jgi:hypothetical protein